jgi:hypothetical protein
MRTIAIVFALALVAAIAPAAPYVPDHISRVVVLFASAWIVLLMGCVAIGSRVFVRRSLTRVAERAPAAGPAIVALPTLPQPGRSVQPDRAAAAAYVAPTFSRPVLSPARPIEELSHAAQIPLEDLEPAGSGSASSRRLHEADL